MSFQVHNSLGSLMAANSLLVLPSLFENLIFLSAIAHYRVQGKDTSSTHIRSYTQHRRWYPTLVFVRIFLDDDEGIDTQINRMITVNPPQIA